MTEDQQERLRKAAVAVVLKWKSWVMMEDQGPIPDGAYRDFWNAMMDLDMACVAARPPEIAKLYE